MELDRALFILADIHTRQRDDIGLEVIMGATPHNTRWTDSEYVEAWKTVRGHVGFSIEPVSTGDRD